MYPRTRSGTGTELDPPSRRWPTLPRVGPAPRRCLSCGTRRDDALALASLRKPGLQRPALQGLDGLPDPLRDGVRSCGVVVVDDEGRGPLRGDGGSGLAE